MAERDLVETDRVRAPRKRSPSSPISISLEVPMTWCMYKRTASRSAFLLHPLHGACGLRVTVLHHAVAHRAHPHSTIVTGDAVAVGVAPPARGVVLRSDPWAAPRNTQSACRHAKSKNRLPTGPAFIEDGAGLAHRLRSHVARRSTGSARLRSRRESSCVPQVLQESHETRPPSRSEAVPAGVP